MARERNVIWDALDLHFGPVRAPQARSMRGKAVQELTEGRYTPEEIAIAYDWCSRNFSPFTEMALAKYIDRAIHENHVKENKPNVVLQLRKMAGLDE